MPPPSPPIVKPGRRIAGRPIFGSARSPSAMLVTTDDLRHSQPRRLHRLAEQQPVLGAADRLVVRADQLHAVAAERAVLPQGAREVEGGPAAERGQQRVGLLALDHRGDRLAAMSGSM